MPLPFITTGLTRIVSTVTTAFGAGTATTILAAARTAINITLTTTQAILAGIGLILGGITITAVIAKKLEDGKKEGIKKGYANASHEYVEKFKCQAEEFLKLTEEYEKTMEGEKKEILKKLFYLYGESEGLLKRMQEDGYSDNDIKKIETIYDTLKTMVKKVEKKSSTT
jgi:hypothetical protein